jgi:Fur family zinc uptake transcriptional regulator
MQQQEIEQIVSKAKDMCAFSGARLTEKRQLILEILLISKTPLSAYEIADNYNKTTESSITAMSVYRMLEFLESEQLAHKLHSTNKYVACSHISCDHSHEVPQFLICSGCQKVKEIAIPKSIIHDLEGQVAEAGYKLTNSQLELQCVCDDCIASE